MVNITPALSLFFLFKEGEKMRIVKKGQTYRHFKGDIMHIIDIARHTETMEELVIYEHLGNIWARPLDMFLSEVDKEKYHDVQQKYRFEEIKED